MKKLIIIAAAIILSGCSDAPTATKALEGAGYSEVNITGYKFFGCSEDDTFHTGFIAKGANGKQVTGVVCSGWLKGSTIRTD